MGKAKSPDELVFQGLLKAYDALPDLLPLTGSKAIFTAKQVVEAETAVHDGFLTTRREAPPGAKGKKSKEVVYGVLTEAGIRKVIEKDSPKGALEALLPAVQSLSRPAASPSPDSFRIELEKATAICVRAIQDAFADLQRDVVSVVSAQRSPAADGQPVLSALRAALERVESPVIKQVPPHSLAQETPTTPPAGLADLEPAILSFIESWAREKSVGPPFDLLMRHLRERHPALTVGAFHDALRRLADARRIRLSGWPKMLDDIPEPELALFVSSKVMYYAHPTSQHG